VLHDEFFDAEETAILNQHDECLDAEETAVPNDQPHENDSISGVGNYSFSPLRSEPNSVADVAEVSFEVTNDDASGMPEPKKKARKRKSIAKENMNMTNNAKKKIMRCT
jgi:hypothetical protein